MGNFSLLIITQYKFYILSNSANATLSLKNCHKYKQSNNNLHRSVKTTHTKN